MHRWLLHWSLPWCQPAPTAPHRKGAKVPDSTIRPKAEGGHGAAAEAWASGDGLWNCERDDVAVGALVRYERAGFDSVSEFTVGTWPGQVLERRLPSGDQ
jgi:hypothetical protein